MECDLVDDEDSDDKANDACANVVSEHEENAISAGVIRFRRKTYLYDRVE